MQLRELSHDPLDDGWTEPTFPKRQDLSLSARILHPGDTVLYRSDRQLTPAVLLEPAGTGCWLARDARSAQGMIYLAADLIATRLPRIDLLGDAA